MTPPVIRSPSPLEVRSGPQTPSATLVSPPSPSDPSVTALHNSFYLPRPSPLYTPPLRYIAPVTSGHRFPAGPAGLRPFWPPPCPSPAPPRSPGTGTWRRRRPPPAGSAPPDQAPGPVAHAPPRAQPHDVIRHHRPASRPPERDGAGLTRTTPNINHAPSHVFLKGVASFFLPRAGVTPVCPPVAAVPRSVAPPIANVTRSIAPAVPAQPCPQLCPNHRHVPHLCPLPQLSPCAVP